MNEENINNETEDKSEIEVLVSDNKEEKSKSTFIKNVAANILDQFILAACASLLILLIDFIMTKCGYRFTRDNGGIISAIAIAYFILNCIYEPIMVKTKLNKTIAKNILNI